MASIYPLLKEVLLADGGVQFILYLLQITSLMVCPLKGEMGSSLLAIYNKNSNKWKILVAPVICCLLWVNPQNPSSSQPTSGVCFRCLKLPGSGPACTHPCLHLLLSRACSNPAPLPYFTAPVPLCSENPSPCGCASTMQNMGCKSLGVKSIHHHEVYTALPNTSSFNHGSNPVW